MTSAIFQFFIFIVIVGAVLFGVYKVAKRNGDLADAKGDLQDMKDTIKGDIASIGDKLPRL